MKVHHKRTSVLFLVLSTLFLLCGCSAEESICKYAENLYGAATYTGSETTDEGTKYNFADSEYGFDYYVSSEDGFSLIPKETKQSNFSMAYLTYADTALVEDYKKIQSDYGVMVILPNRTVEYLRFCSVMTDNEETGKKAAEALIEIYKGYDTRKWWQGKGLAVEILDPNQIRYGSLYYDGLRYISKEESELMYYTNYVHRTIDDKAEYKDKAKVTPEKFASLLEGDVLTEDGWDIDETVTIYYFVKSDGTDLYIADAYFHGVPFVFKPYQEH